MGILKKIKQFFKPYAEHRYFYPDGCDFCVHFMDFDELNKLYRENYPNGKPQVNGFTFKGDATDIYVAYDYTKKDIDGEYLPMLETLGHELMHKIKIGWHK